jgi:hypothetical protein
MRTHRIVGVHLRKRVRTTVPEPSHQKVPDLLKRDFTADAANQRYVGDITYLPVADGRFLYLATVIDLHSRRLAGWSIADHMRTELVSEALRAAAATRGGTWPGRSFTQITGRNIPPPTSPPSAPSSASASRWARWARARTTPLLRRSTPRSNARPCRAPGAGARPVRPVWRSSRGSLATTPEGDTPARTTSARSTTSSRPIRCCSPLNSRCPHLGGTLVRSSRRCCTACRGRRYVGCGCGSARTRFCAGTAT